MSFLAPAAMIGGAALSAFGGLEGAAGTLQAGRAGSQASYYQAAVAANNAQIAEQQATRTEAAGAAKTEDVSLRSAANVGSIKASQGASGVDVNSGSALNVQATARREGQLAAQRTQENAEEQAYGFRVQAQSDRAQAQLDQMAGKSIMEGAERAATTQRISALSGGLLGGAQSVSPKWTNWLNSGASG